MASEQNPYTALGLDESASDADIRRAYRKLSMQFHPDKNLGDEGAASSRFHEVQCAFNELSSPEAREKLDRRLASERARRDTDRTQTQFVTPSLFDGPDDAARTATTTMPDFRRHADNVKELDLECTLEELYSGAKKRLRLSRKGSDHTVEIKVKPGWKAGTRISFDGASAVEGRPIVFVIKEKPHPTFKREGSTLRYTAEISLLQALRGSSFKLHLLDGRKVRIPIQPLAHSKQTVALRGEGMPRVSGGKGDLIVDFKVTLPSVGGDCLDDMEGLLNA